MTDNKIEIEEIIPDLDDPEFDRKMKEARFIEGGTDLSRSKYAALFKTICGEPFSLEKYLAKSSVGEIVYRYHHPEPEEVEKIIPDGAELDKKMEEAGFINDGRVLDRSEYAGLYDAIKIMLERNEDNPGLKNPEKKKSNENPT